MVVAILAILLTLLLPVLAAVRQQQKRIVCAAHLRQVGTGALSWSIDYRGRLPDHHANPALSFDTVEMATETARLVNLGLLAPRLTSPGTFYCPSYDETRSSDLAFNSTKNPWSRRPNHDDDPPGKGPPGGIPPGLAKRPSAGTNASFAARSRAHQPNAQPVWAVRHHANKVIYTDFLGVDGWVGGGRFNGQIDAPHEGRGYNRLFGDVAVQWVDAGPINDLRPVGPVVPSAAAMDAYFKLLDVLP